jgi:predicted outer membrane repeat protein
MHPIRTSLVGAALAAALTFAAALPCAAATLYVTSTADNGDPGTLRAALASADEHDTIEITATGTIYLTSGELAVYKSVTITGPGPDLLTVDGKQLSRAFHIGWGQTVAISGLTIANGLADWGGGVLNLGELTLSDCSLSTNEARTGGAIYSEGTLTLEDCTLGNNTAHGYWEQPDDIVYAKGGAIRVSSDSPPGVSITVNRCTLSGNTASGYGTIEEPIEFGVGGGIFVSAYQKYGEPPVTVTVTVTDSTLVDNTASGKVGANGGAIAIGDVDDGQLDVDAYYQVGANFIIRNSTLTGNTAVAAGGAGGSGGAISNFLGSLTIDNSTLTGNSDDWNLSDPGGGAIVNGLGSLKIKNTILANATPDASPNVIDYGLLLGGESLVEDLGFNLCNDDCSALLNPETNLLNTDPMLGPLADNGGPTLTHALEEESPAIDAADDTDSAGDSVAFDQRGVPRPLQGANDIGAFEFVQATMNRPPTADPNGPHLVAVNAQFAVDGSASWDPDGDSLTYSWNWQFANTTTVVSPSFAAPAVPGIYPLALTVSDGKGGVDTAWTSVVVFDASAGFVTGGGWIDSPAGAYLADPDLTGKATFGFVSKYRKGATVPTGNTAFEFAAGDLHFQSTGYEWLVVTGNDYARFKGSGTINGAGDYRFMVWAGDDEPDTFRIRIWQEDETTGVETDIYDNGYEQPIGGGSIVIHTK